MQRTNHRGITYAFWVHYFRTAVYVSRPDRVTPFGDQQTFRRQLKSITVPLARSASPLS